MYGGGATGKALVFVETKKDADELAAHPAILAAAGGECRAMHGDVAQNQREATLAAFRKGTLRCIVATDGESRVWDTSYRKV